MSKNVDWTKGPELMTLILAKAGESQVQLMFDIGS
jgi:hypothetical protein